MTVQELIAELEKKDPQLPVHVVVVVNDKVIYRDSSAVIDATSDDGEVQIILSTRRQ